MKSTASEPGLAVWCCECSNQLTLSTIYPAHLKKSFQFRTSEYSLRTYERVSPPKTQNNYVISTLLVMLTTTIDIATRFQIFSGEPQTPRNLKVYLLPIALQITRLLLKTSFCFYVNILCRTCAFKWCCMCNIGDKVMWVCMNRKHVCITWKISRWLK